VLASDPRDDFRGVGGRTSLPLPLAAMGAKYAASYCILSEEDVALTGRNTPGRPRAAPWRVTLHMRVLQTTTTTSLAPTLRVGGPVIQTSSVVVQAAAVRFTPRTELFPVRTTRTLTAQVRSAFGMWTYCADITSTSRSMNRSALKTHPTAPTTTYR